jgi:DNA polymerase III epsilon subunit-like protein
VVTTFHGTNVVDTWSTFVNPGRPIVGNQMHGITDKDVKGAPTPKAAADQLLKFVGDAMVVGHNVGFDLGFIEEAKGEGFRFAPGSYLDTLVIAREGYPGAESYKLGDLARFFGIEVTQSHRALSDAQATANLLLWFANDLPGRITKLKGAIADAVRANRTGGDTNALL